MRHCAEGLTARRTAQSRDFNSKTYRNARDAHQRAPYAPSATTSLSLKMQEGVVGLSCQCEEWFLDNFSERKTLVSVTTRGTSQHCVVIKLCWFNRPFCKIGAQMTTLRSLITNFKSHLTTLDRPDTSIDFKNLCNIGRSPT